MLAAISVGQVILAEAGLSFIGAGVQNPDVTWGLLISGGRKYLTVAWWPTVFPGLFAGLTVFALNGLARRFTETDEARADVAPSARGRGPLLLVPDPPRRGARRSTACRSPWTPGESLGVVGRERQRQDDDRAVDAAAVRAGVQVRLSGTGAASNGVDLLRMSDRDLRTVRGGQIAMVFQDPLTSLDPVMAVGEQIAEAVRLHKGVSRRAARSARSS